MFLSQIEWNFGQPGLRWHFPLFYYLICPSQTYLKHFAVYPDNLWRLCQFFFFCTSYIHISCYIPITPPNLDSWDIDSSPLLIWSSKNRIIVQSLGYCSRPTRVAVCDCGAVQDEHRDLALYHTSVPMLHMIFLVSYKPEWWFLPQ